MPETLAIRLPEEPTADATWTIVDDAGTRIGYAANGPLSKAAGAQQQRQVLILVPGTQTVSARATLPVRSASKMLQVAPFALEDQLAGDVTQMHFALGRRNKQGQVEIVATDRDRMRAWLQQLEDAGIHAQRIVAETAGVPATENGITVLMLADECCVRDSDGNVFYVDQESLLETLKLLGEAPAPDLDDAALVTAAAASAAADDTALTVFLAENIDAETDALLARVQQQFPAAEFRRLHNGLLPRLAAEVLDNDAPNMLQGEFAPSGRLIKHWLPWRSSAALAAALVLVAVGVKAAEYFTYKSRYQDLRVQMEEIYASALPGDPTAVDDPRALFERRLTQSGDGGAGSASDFIDGLGAVSDALPEGGGTTLKSLNFSAGIINLEVIAPDIPTLDGVRQKVASGEGWDARLTQTRPEADKVEGRLQIQRRQQ